MPPTSWQENSPVTTTYHSQTSWRERADFNQQRKIQEYLLFFEGRSFELISSCHLRFVNTNSTFFSHLYGINKRGNVKKGWTTTTTFYRPGNLPRGKPLACLSLWLVFMWPLLQRRLTILWSWRMHNQQHPPLPSFTLLPLWFGRFLCFYPLAYIPCVIRWDASSLPPPSTRQSAEVGHSWLRLVLSDDTSAAPRKS